MVSLRPDNVRIAAHALDKMDAIHQAGEVKKSTEAAPCEKLLSLIDDISDVFWQTEKAKGMGVYPPS